MFQDLMRIFRVHARRPRMGGERSRVFICLNFWTHILSHCRDSILERSLRAKTPGLLGEGRGTWCRPYRHCSHRLREIVDQPEKTLKPQPL